MATMHRIRLQEAEDRYNNSRIHRVNVKKYSEVEVFPWVLNGVQDLSALWWSQKELESAISFLSSRLLNRQFADG